MILVGSLEIARIPDRGYICFILLGGLFLVIVVVVVVFGRNKDHLGCSSTNNVCGSGRGSRHCGSGRRIPGAVIGRVSHHSVKDVVQNLGEEEDEETRITLVP